MSDACGKGGLAGSEMGQDDVDNEEDEEGDWGLKGKPWLEWWWFGAEDEEWWWLWVGLWELVGDGSELDRVGYVADARTSSGETIQRTRGRRENG